MPDGGPGFGFADPVPAFRGRGVSHLSPARRRPGGDPRAAVSRPTSSSRFRWKRNSASSSAERIERLGPRIQFVPAVVFAAFHPDITYLERLDGSRVQTPMTDYNSAIAVRCLSVRLRHREDAAFLQRLHVSGAGPFRSRREQLAKSSRRFRVPRPRPEGFLGAMAAASRHLSCIP